MQDSSSSTKISGTDSKKDIRLIVRNALLSSTVLLFIVFSTLILYFNFVSIAPYISSIIWGIMLSIPLHYVKRQLLVVLSNSTDPETISSGTLRALVWSVIKEGFKIMCAPLVQLYRKYVPPSIQDTLDKRFALASAAGKVSGHSAKVKVSAIYSHFSMLPSSFYFGLLFAASIWWIVIKILLHIPMFFWIPIIIILVLFASLKAFRQAFGSLWRGFRKRIFGLRTPKSVPGTIVLSKDKAEKKLHSRLASFLIFGSTCIFYSLIILTVLQTIFHARYIVTYGVSSLMSGEQFSGLRNATTEYAATAASWIDSQINERFPSANFSATEVLNLAMEFHNGTSNPLISLYQQTVVALKNYNMSVTSSFIESSFLDINSTFSYGEMFQEWKSVLQLAWAKNFHQSKF